MSKFFETVGVFVLTTLVTFIFALWGGYVLMILWGWFLTPLGVPTIGLANMMGIIVMVSLFKTNLAKDESKSDPYTKIGMGIASPALALLVGYIIKGFM